MKTGLSILFMLSMTAHAIAHTVASPIRYRLEIRADRIVFTAITIVPSGVESGDFLDRFDRDGDGRLSTNEASALEQRISVQRLQDCWMKLNGESVSLRATAVSSSGLLSQTKFAEEFAVSAVFEAEHSGENGLKLSLSCRTSQNQSELPLKVLFVAYVPVQPAMSDHVHLKGGEIFSIHVRKKTE